MNIYNRIAILSEQDPLKSFDPGSVSRVDSISTNIDLFLVINLIAIVMIAIGLYIDSKSLEETSGPILIIFGIMLFVGSALFSFINFSEESSKHNAVEFSQWADARYDVEIRDDQYSTLNTIKGWHNGAGFSNPVLTDAGFVKAWIENERVTLMFDDEKAKELPISEKLTEKK